MRKRKRISPEALDASLPQQRKPIPHSFVLDAISTLSPYTRPMFGCLAIYAKDKIVFILRDKPTHAADNGVWLATTEEHYQTLCQWICRCPLCVGVMSQAKISHEVIAAYRDHTDRTPSGEQADSIVVLLRTILLDRRLHSSSGE